MTLNQGRVDNLGKLTLVCCYQMVIGKLKQEKQTTELETTLRVCANNKGRLPQFRFPRVNFKMTSNALLFLFNLV